MLLLEEVRDSQFNADKVFKAGGISLISTSPLQSSKISLRKKRHSLMHSGRIENSLPDRSNSLTLANHMRPIAKDSSERMHLLRQRYFTFEGCIVLLSSSPFCFGNS